MLKFVGQLKNGTTRLSSRKSPWYTSNHQSLASCSGVAAAPQSKSEIETPPVSSPPKNPGKPRKLKNSMVQEAFSRMDLAPEDLLSSLDKSSITYQQALNAVRLLSQQVEKGKIELSILEKDSRYQKVCSIIASQSIQVNKNKRNKLEGFNNSAGDVEAAYVKNYSLAQTINVLSGLAVKQSRTKPLLQKLTENIINTNEKLTIKNIGDILYSVAKLSFTDETLLRKLSEELKKVIGDVNHSPIIGSVLTSLGMMRYRDDELMEKLCEWAIRHKDSLRTQDVCALLMTLAVTGCNPPNFRSLYDDLIVNLKETDMIRVSEWVDVVWSLVVLNQATKEQIESTLCDKFISQILDQDPAASKKHKLLNINAAAKYLLSDYSGPLLKDDSPVMQAPIARMKDKETFVKAITDALANLFPSRDHFRSNVNVQTGFLIDVEFFVDKKLTTLAINNVTKDSKAFRIAIVANYYHDYCVGKKTVIGPILLQNRILEAMGYRILDIPHSEFHADDKLLKRISYINDRIKTIVK